ncbi:MAG: type-F conjugative transfer system pilin assembly protein TrbC [Caedibacter sp. 37-49]|nr:MAG: type-F conjugative transfer system pilin assembly protein TrbC [Caedibacter sp. 37-49]
MLPLVNFTNKFKYIIIYLSLTITVQALCQKEYSSRQTCPVQKLSITQEEHLPTVLVFASFSMPETALKQLANDLKKVGGALVIRGLINNSFKDTSLYLQKLGEGVLLDPTLFEKFNIVAVPTFIIVEGDLKNEQTPRHDKLQGNVSLRFVLERAIKEGEIRNTYLLLEKLQGSA